MCEFKDILCVTNRSLCRRPLEEQIELVCARHPRAVILREKDLPEAEYENLARRILPICLRYNVPLIPHFYPEAARALGIRRIHLPLWKLRRIAAEKMTADELPPWNMTADGIVPGNEVPERELDELEYFDVIGCSVHSVNEAKEAVRAGATYLSAGHIFETDCKKGLPPRGPDFLRGVCSSVPVPVYAIGGIHPEDAAQLAAVRSCGAAGVCVMSALMKM